MFADELVPRTARTSRTDGFLPSASICAMALRTSASSMPLTVLPLRKDAPNSAVYGGPQVAAQQHAAYPDIQPLHLDLPASQAFPRALEPARAVGWEIIAEVPDQGRIEATATAFWFGFKDDIVVRVRAEGSGGVMDVRSESRVSKSDVGTNAARICGHLRKLADGD